MARVIILLITLMLIGCSTEPSYRTIEGFTQGTTYQITYKDTANHRTHIETFLSEFDSSLSIYNQNSLINRINSGQTNRLDSWTRECLELSDSVYNMTSGLFDPTLAPLIAAYGFARKEQQADLSEQQRIDIMQRVGFNKVSVDSMRIIKDRDDIELNFNAIAQGYAVDKLAELLESLGIRDYMVEVGGEIYCSGVSPRGTPWRIGIDVPSEGNMVAGTNIATVVELSGRGLATSGNYRKFIDLPSGERITHSIDPRTGLSTRHNLLSATIIAPSAALSDGIATASMVGGLQWTKALIDTLKVGGMAIDCYLIYAEEGGEMASYSTLNL